jgi:hypothetical protein
MWMKRLPSYWVYLFDIRGVEFVVSASARKAGDVQLRSPTFWQPTDKIVFFEWDLVYPDQDLDMDVSAYQRQAQRVLPTAIRKIVKTIKLWVREHQPRGIAFRPTTQKLRSLYAKLMVRVAIGTNYSVRLDLEDEMFLVRKE